MMPTPVLRILAVLTVIVVAVSTYFVFNQPTSASVALVATATAAPVNEESDSPVSPAVGETPTLAASATALPPTEIPATATPAPTSTPMPPRISEEDALATYGNQPFESLDAMPPELRRFYTDMANAAGEFFAVRSEDVLALVQQQGGGVFRLPLAEGELVSLVPTELWNGAAAPTGTYITNQRQIEQSGGVGFTWSDRHQWQAWSASQISADAVVELNANPYLFSDSVAALARYLALNGATTSLEASDPDQFAQNLTAALDGVATATSRSALAAPAANPSANEWAAALQNILDERLAMSLSDEEAVALVESMGIAGRAASPAEGATILYAELTQGYMSQAQAADSNAALPFPYIKDSTDLAVQEASVRVLGHVLTAPDLELLRNNRQDNVAEIEELLTTRPEATLYSESRALVDNGLQRSARGLRLWNYEVSGLVQSALNVSTGNNSGNRNQNSGSTSTRNQTRTQIRLRSELEYYLRRLPEYRALNGDQFFAASPFDPMPNMGQPYGSPVDYQPGGYHTGVDIRARSTSGEQPLIYAVDDATVTYVGPLYCLSATACRGAYAVVLDHGGNVYTIYSHNSEAFVTAGQQVSAGEVIARQGSEGYSRSPHLHLELHVGSPYSGVWTDPWRGGQFADPWPWLPKENEVLAPA